MDFFKCLGGYFAMMFVLTWIAEKLFGDFELMGLYLVNGHFFKGLFIAAVAYFIYFISAGVIASQGHSGKASVAVIIAFSLFNMYNDIQDFAGKSEGIEYVGSVMFYLFAMLNDTLRIVATIHAFND